MQAAKHYEHVGEVLRTAELNEAKTGEYQLRIHVIEARGLQAKDLSGTCDPYVEVEAFGQKRRSQTKPMETSPVWDENIFIIQKDVDHARLDREQIRISVFDQDVFTSNDLIGSYYIDATYLYFHKQNHRIYRKWLVLTAPFESRQGGLFMDDSPEDAQGYLQVTVSLLGPGDEAALSQSNPEEEKLAIEAERALVEEEASKRELRKMAKSVFSDKRMKRAFTSVMPGVPDERKAPPRMGAVLRPPGDQIKTTRVYLRVGVHRATGLPDLDTVSNSSGASHESLVHLLSTCCAPPPTAVRVQVLFDTTHVKGGRLDAFVQLDFAGNVAKTKSVKSNQPVWDTEFWLPVLVPCSGQQMRVTVFDGDTFNSDDEIGQVIVDAFQVALSAENCHQLPPSATYCRQVIIDFDDIMSGKTAELAWYHLYGVGPEATRKLDASLLNLDLVRLLANGRDRAELGRYQREYAEWKGSEPSMIFHGPFTDLPSPSIRYASEWKGKVLLQVHVLDPDLRGSHSLKKDSILNIIDGFGKKKPKLPEKVRPESLLLSPA